jgi:hypothetical protein
MNGRMDSYVKAQITGRLEGRLVGWSDGCMNGSVDREMDGRITSWREAAVSWELVFSAVVARDLSINLQTATSCF